MVKQSVNGPEAIFSRGELSSMQIAFAADRVTSPVAGRKFAIAYGTWRSEKENIPLKSAILFAKLDLFVYFKGERCKGHFFLPPKELNSSKSAIFARYDVRISEIKNAALSLSTLEEAENFKVAYAHWSYKWMQSVDLIRAVAEAEARMIIILGDERYLELFPEQRMSKSLLPMF